MSTKVIRKEKLTRAEVDKLSEEIDLLLEKNKTDKTMRMRIRYTLEDMILSVCERLGEDTSYTLSSGSMLGRKCIRFSYEGMSFDPCTASDDPSGNWSSRIMSDMGLSPVWQYKNGVNALELRLKRKSIGSMGAILIAIALAVLLGFTGEFLLSPDIKTDFSEMLFKPCQSIFFSLLKVFSGLMILLSVSCGIFNMGDMSSFSKIGKLMFRRFIGFTVLIAAVLSGVCFFLFPSASAAEGSGGVSASGISDILDMIFDIVPSDIVSPFAEGNAMQIVLISVILGISILLLGEKTAHLRSVAEDMNSLIMSILSGVCKLLPFYIFFLFTDMIWSGTFRQIADIWKPFTAIVIMWIFLISGSIVYFSVKYRIGLTTVVKKLFPTFFTVFTTASTIAAFGQTIDDCINKFGVSENYVKVAHPIRNVIYKPGLIIELAVLIYSMAQMYDITVDITWMILGVIICTVLTIAVPPIPGAATMLFSILFTQMGIPTEAMAFAVTCDIFYDFLDASFNNTIGILECAFQADKLDMLDKEVLRDKTA